MSQLSLSHVSEAATTPRASSRTRSKTGIRGKSASSSGLRGHGSRRASNTSVSDHHERAGHHEHGSIAGSLLSASFLLGGEPLQPPRTADLRNESEAAEAGDLEAWEDNDPTPMPNRFPGGQDGWLTRPPITRPSETTSLLGQRSTSGNSYASISANGDHGSNAAAGPSQHHHHSNPHASGLLPSGSAWANMGNLASPLPPPLAVIDEIEHEAPTDNVQRRELWILTKYSLPVWGTHLLELSLNVVSVFSIGHLGTTQLAAASLSSMTANVTAFSLLSGFISALDSLLPPAFTQQPKRVGVYTQSMAIIVFGLCFPIALVWLNAERVLLALGQDQEVARLSGLYLRVMLPGVPAYAGFEVCRRYLQAQGLMSASTMVLLLVSPLNAFLNWLLVWGPDSVRLGFVGAPLASAISNWIMFILAIGQCYLTPRTAWGGFSLSSALKKTNMAPCLSLGFYGFLAISSEWWAWEISSLITSMLGTTPLAAQSVLLVCSSIFYQQPFAISVAAAVRIGNLLGALKPYEAQASSNASLLLSLGSGVLNSSLVLLFKNEIAGLFSEDPEVISLLTGTLPLLALFQLADAFAGVAGGILRGTGRQHLGAYMNMFAYYVVALPLGAWLTFRYHGDGMGLKGMWVGLTTALAISAVGGCWLVSRTKWTDEVRKVQARMGEDGVAAPAAGGH